MRSDITTHALEYWIPAFAGTTPESFVATFVHSQHSLHWPGQALGEPTPHDPLLVLGAEEMHLLRIHGDGLRIGALRARQHDREVGAPETTARCERLDEIAQRAVNVAIGIGRRRALRRERELHMHVRIFR